MAQPRSNKLLTANNGVEIFFTCDVIWPVKTALQVFEVPEFPTFPPKFPLTKTTSTAAYLRAELSAINFL